MSRLYWSNLPEANRPRGGHQRLVQLIDDSGLADARIAGHEHEFRRAVRHDPIEGREQHIDLALPAVELLRNQQPVRTVVRAQREPLDMAMRVPIRQAAPEIGLDACGGLVALLGGLGEELHDDCRERDWHICNPLMGRHRSPRDMAVHPLHRIGGSEGELPRQHFVEGDTQSIEIAAGVHRAVHPAGLFRRHVGERPRDHLRRREGLALARQTRGNAKPRQPHAATCRVHQDIGRLDVLMDETPLMYAAQRRCKRDRDAQEMR